jgi:hypothetical protein
MTYGIARSAGLAGILSGCLHHIIRLVTKNAGFVTGRRRHLKASYTCDGLFISELRLPIAIHSRLQSRNREDTAPVRGLSS